MKKMKRGLTISILCVLAVSAILFIFQQHELAAKYNEAVSYAEKGDYEKAFELMDKMGIYRDSEDKLQEYENELNYQAAKEHYAAGEYDEAINLFGLLSLEGKGYKD